MSVIGSRRGEWGGMVGGIGEFQFNTCPTTTLAPLQPGESCWVKLVGLPGVKGRITGSWVVHDLKDPTEPLLATVPVTIIGVPKDVGV
jgi:hypothetical protein